MAKNWMPTAISAAKRAAELGVRVFTVGIGSGEGSLIPLRTDDGGTDFVRDTAGKPVQSRLDEKRLKEIAESWRRFLRTAWRRCGARDL